MKLTSTLLFTILSLYCCNVSASKLIVVANIERENFTVQKRQVRDIFMKSTSDFILTPVVLSSNNEVRFLFNTKVVGLTESRIQSYWAQMRFTGRKKPPKEFTSLNALLSYVQSNKNAVAYLPGDFDVPKGLKVIYRVN